MVMLSNSIVAELDRFLSGVSAMSVDDFQKIREHTVKNSTVQSASSSLLKLSAADFSWLDSRVRGVVAPLMMSLPWKSDRLSYSAVYRVLDAAQAIVRRDRLSVVLYEAFVGGFRRVGLSVPSHGGEAGEAGL
jgi:hypothetical protein